MLAETTEVLAIRALELQVGKARVAVSLDRIDRVVQTPCARIPTSHPLVRGIGFDGERPIICVFLGRRAEDHPGDVTAVLLLGAGEAQWAVCADRVLGVVTVADRSTKSDTRLPRWLNRARTSEGRALAWLDPELMVRDIGAEKP